MEPTSNVAHNNDLT